MHDIVQNLLSYTALASKQPITGYSNGSTTPNKGTRFIWSCTPIPEKWPGKTTPSNTKQFVWSCAPIDGLPYYRHTTSFELMASLHTYLSGMQSSKLTSQTSLYQCKIIDIVTKVLNQATNNTFDSAENCPPRSI